MIPWIARAAAGCLALAALTVASAGAQDAPAFPSRPVRMIVPFAAAGTADIVTRLTASCMAPFLGQPVVVENRGGAGGTIGTDAVAKAAPDGYTVALHTVSSAVLNSFLYHRLPYDARRDFVAVSQVAQSPNVLAIRADIPARNVQEFIALMKAKPGGYSYGTSGPGTILHLSAALFTRMAGVEATHVPYRGEGPAINDMMAGQIDFMVNVVPALLPYVRDGRFRALAVTTRERAAILPEVPTVAESGLPEYETYIWHGIFAPAGTPAPVVERLADAAIRAVNDSGCRQRMTDLGLTPVGSRPAEFTAFWDRQLAYWGPVVKTSGATLD
ncbi:Tripartite-type tricarboxylate transporter, receptor component TctC [Roseomonas rosea]|uniref:Tripartite-type tricarboxylate transporter, receptor component TctC n=1 Tax=Muricoccus roseus TaxID=198092 RepID=A0A1M6J0P3_9PROT|nr:tripartite tricarboxylate transporter substrate binding protein [Roseomonas rosea]SHJ40284.1 Tripartite-type tricarboxylate transporter, receptor component TctC [Roseomonas rosea]